MNPNEENNKPLNNSADTPTPASEPAATPEPTTTSKPVITPEPATNPEKKSATSTIVLVVIAAVLVIVGVVVTIMLINNQSNNNTNDEETAKNSGTTLVCTASADASTAASSFSNADAYRSTLYAYYDAEDNLENIEVSEEFDFKDEQSAKNYLDSQKSAYDKTLASLNLSSDPFETDFDVQDNTATIYRFVDAGLLNKDNASILMLKVNDDGSVNTSADSITDVYTSAPKIAYECTLQSEYTDEEDVEDDTEEDTTGDITEDVEEGAVEDTTENEE